MGVGDTLMLSMVLFSLPRGGPQCRRACVGGLYRLPPLFACGGIGGGVLVDVLVYH